MGNYNSHQGVRKAIINDQVMEAISKLFAVHKLTPSAEASKMSVKLHNDHGYFEMVNNASSEAGFNLKPYRDATVTAVKYLLKDTSQGINGKIYAYILLDGNKIIGAYNVLEGILRGLWLLMTSHSLIPRELIHKN